MTAVHNDPPHAAGIVLERLHAVRRRMWAFFFLYWGKGLFACANAAVLVLGICRFLRGEPLWDVWSAAILVWSVVMTFLMTFGLNGSPRSLDHAAFHIDRFALTHNRFHTALVLSRRVFSKRTLLETLALEECARFIETFDHRRVLPVRPTRAWLFAAAPLVSLGLLAWHASLKIGEAPRDPALDAAVARRAEALGTMAERLRHDDRQRPDMDKIAEAMKRSAERLKDSQHEGDEQKLKTALGEISSLEAMLAAMKQAAKDQKISPGELAALAAALAASETAEAVGESVEQGQLEQAGDQLEKLAEQMKEQGNGAQALQELAKSMQEQAAKLSEFEKNEVAQQMQQAAQSAQSGEAQLSAQAMQRLAELLRKAGKSGAGRQASNKPGAGGGPMSQQQLQDLLNSLENMKEGLQPGGEGQMPGQPGDGQESGQSLALVESFAKKEGGEPGSGEKPSGMPGGERDQGTNDHLLADRAAAAPKSEGPSKRLEGMLGDGASLQELVGATSGAARASRPYRNLYEAIAPAEQNSVEQEEIPLGSRYFVRRYFENIRPEN